MYTHIYIDITSPILIFIYLFTFIYLFKLVCQNSRSGPAWRTPKRKNNCSNSHKNILHQCSLKDRTLCNWVHIFCISKMGSSNGRCESSFTRYFKDIWNDISCIDSKLERVYFIFNLKIYFLTITEGRVTQVAFKLNFYSFLFHSWNFKTVFRVP